MNYLYLARSYAVALILPLMLAACGGGSSTESNNESKSPAQKEVLFEFLNEEVEITATESKNNPFIKSLEFEIYYSSSDETVAGVDALGVVIGRKIGVATIIATADVDGQVYTASYLVSVKGISPELLFSGGNLEVSKECGDTFVRPATLTDPVEIIYSSNNNEIAQVDSKGMVHTLLPGSTQIKVTSQPTDLYASTQVSYLLHVIKARQSLSFSESSRAIKFGQNAIPLEVSESGPGNIEYASSNTSIVTIDSMGTLQPLKTGVAVITAAKQGDECHHRVSASYTVEVKKSVPEIGFTAAEGSITFGDVAEYSLLNPEGLTVKYTTSESSIAAFDESGQLVIKQGGTVDIIATIAETYTAERAEARYVLLINKANQSPFYFRQASETIRFGNIRKLFTEGGSGSGQVVFESDDPSSLTISPGGYVQIKKVPVGSVSITATKIGDKRFKIASAVHTFYIKRGVQRLTINGGQEQNITYDTKQSLSIYVPVGGGDGELSYLSDSPNIVSVDDLGVMKGLRLGRATVSVSLSETSHYEKLTKTIQVNVQKIDQPLTSDLDLVSIRAGSGAVNNNVKCSNVSSCDSQNQIQFSSNRPGIVSIDSLGNITALEKGSSTITAFKSAAPHYNSSSITFNVNSLPKNIIVPIEVGIEESRFSFEPYLHGTIFTSSNSEQCAFFPFQGTCEQWAKKAYVSDLYISSPHIGAYQKGYFRLNIDSATSPIKTDFINTYSKRDLSAKAWFKGRFWVVGGRRSSALLKDIWSSADGISWNLETMQAPFLPRKEHQLVTFTDPYDGKEKLWLIGGLVQAVGYSSSATTESKGDIWNSVDGITWQRVLSTSPFVSRGGHIVKVFIDPSDGIKKLWIFGGRNQTANNWYKLFDVWTSINGRSWQKKSSSFGHLSDVIDVTLINQPSSQVDSLWILTRDLNNLEEYDLRSSSDGSSWSHIASTKNNTLPGLTGWQTGKNLYSVRSIATNEDRLFFMNKNLWSSSNGINWVKESELEFSQGDVLTVHENNADDYWLFNNSFGDQLAYKSTDGIQWNYQGNGDVPDPRHGFSSVVFKPESSDTEILHIVGGFNSEPKLDAWLYDEVSWDQTFSDSIPAHIEGYRLSIAKDPRDQKNKIWLYGGEEKYFGNSNLYSSINGKDWIEESKFHQDSILLSDTPMEKLQFSHIKDATGVSERLIVVKAEQSWGRSNGHIFLSENAQDWRVVNLNVDIDLTDSITLIERPHGLPGILIKDGSDKVFYSEMGDVWVEQVSNFPLSQGSIGRILKHVDKVDNIEKVWLFSGSRLWNSLDGITWNLISDEVKRPSDENMVVLSMNHQFVSVVHNSSKGISDQIWYSDDGIFWYMKRSIEIPE